MKPIYLDHNGTTPVDPRVVSALLPYLEEHFGNASTRSVYGQAARAGLDRAREQVARYLGCQPDEVYFTSGATESNNWVIQGRLSQNPDPHIVTSTIEHPSVLKTLDYLEKQGRVRVTRVGVDRHGMVSPAEVLAAVTPQTVLVSIMHSNNEVGTLQPIHEIGAALPADVPLHTDAAQSPGKVFVDLSGVTFLSLAGHKMYAPKGIGALFIRKGAALDPLLFGAGHERGLRSGTENVAFAVALGEACSLLDSEEGIRLARLRDRLQQLLEEGADVSINGHPSLRLANTLSVNFHGTTGAEITARCPGLAASTGPACHDGVVRLSHVLQAMGVDPERGKGAVRLTLGRSTTLEQVEQAAGMLVSAARQTLTHT